MQDAAEPPSRLSSWQRILNKWHGEEWHESFYGNPAERCLRDAFLLCTPRVTWLYGPLQLPVWGRDARTGHVLLTTALHQCLQVFESVSWRVPFMEYFLGLWPRWAAVGDHLGRPPSRLLLAMAPEPQVRRAQKDVYGAIGRHVGLWAAYAQALKDMLRAPPGHEFVVAVFSGDRGVAADAAAHVSAEGLKSCFIPIMCSAGPDTVYCDTGSIVDLATTRDALYLLTGGRVGTPRGVDIMMMDLMQMAVYVELPNFDDLAGLGKYGHGRYGTVVWFATGSALVRSRRKHTICSIQRAQWLHIVSLPNLA